METSMPSESSPDEKDSSSTITAAAMSEQETERLIWLGLRYEVNEKANLLMQALELMKNAMDTGYNYHRVKSPINTLRQAIDEFDAALIARERRSHVAEAGNQDASPTRER